MVSFLNSKELADVLNVPRSTVQFYAREMGLPYKQIGKHKRFNLDEVLKWSEIKREK
ncbi:helix-turn-helix domain-containing protein [Candidatus Omnitrophota bacterium]